MTKQFRTEIIAVGTELLLGQIANTNAQWMSEKLAAIGMNVFHHSVVGDNLQRVKEQFQHSKNRADVIIVTGGLGPTEDDLTREAFQKIVKRDIIEHRPSMEKIEAFYRKQKSKMTPNNRKQARVFTGADVIENNVGMAPGMIVSENDTTWIFLPGVPREMKQMMSDKVMPYLQQLTGESSVIKSTMLRFIGIGESQLEDELSDIIQNQSNPTIAPLAQSEGIAIRLTAKANTQEEATNLISKTKQQIQAKVGDHMYGADEQTIEENVFALLKAQNKYIGAAESLTGGMFTEKLIAVEGASKVSRGGLVCYDTNVKENVLHISPETIRQYGTVSDECAAEMSRNICTLLDSDIGISFTGAAGPDSVEGHPPGTVFIAVYDSSKVSIARKFTFQGSRQTIRKKATLKGFELLYNLLK
ncbi:competence/damage-inducible protein cinA [Virgibacillus subterraneus]|uniref:Putative competence-damage inducible protein n=1 Tax=Virgibacillus subterraneus TaxID=621109 RepID=A0A1H9H1G4_9BACI|nr:competence/damage-inducible protein A [Virgibacillus subterraneus]SEQ56181.1 competence/damage-inducible protein cinA [Virgibacillus subterraneus]